MKKRFKKKCITVLIALFIIAVISVVALIFNKDSEKSSKSKDNIITTSLTIAHFSAETSEEISKKVITNSEELQTVKNYIDKIKYPGEHESIDLVLLNEIIINYDDIIIIIQIGEKEHCYYHSKDKSSVVYLPEELYDWAIEKLNISEE